jgi:hypothetical protein
MNRPGHKGSELKPVSQHTKTQNCLQGVTQSTELRYFMKYY